jgi:DNA-binding beta-propeller fold protein YncE
VLLLGLALVVFAVGLAAMPARAGAATVESGALSQLAEPFSCIGETKEEVAKCGESVPYGLSFAYQLQVSPNAKNAYSVSVNGSLIEYSRNPANGELTVIGCFSSLLKSEPACAEHAEMEVAAVERPAAIVVSPDGTSAYVVTQGANNLVEFSRNPETGLLTKIGCITHESTSSECATTGAKGLNLPYGVAISPDGENVYVTGFADEAIAEFKRNTETGVLTQLAAPNNCISDTTLSECGTTTGVIGLKEAIGIAVSPDGKDLYVAAGARSAEGDVAAFERGSEGTLTQLPGKEACISEVVTGCTVGQYIQGSEDLAVSPDGVNVYANSASTNAVIELKRTGTGALEQLASPNECVSSKALTGCQEVKEIGGAVGIAISPDGKNLYASSSGQSAVGAFKRGAEGVLEQLAKDPCVTEEASGCEPLSSNGLVGLKYARRLTVSPDGTNIYVVGQEAHAIVELARTVTPTVSSVSLDHGTLGGEGFVRINGSGFSEDAKGIIKVSFGGTDSPEVRVNSASAIMAKSPTTTKEEVVHVTVENEAGLSTEVPTGQFDYTNKPVVAGVTAGIGSETGGTTVTITGSELAGASVDFGSTPALSITSNTAESITAISPPGVGTVDVTVTTAHGTSETGAADKFTYIDGSSKPAGGLFLEGYCQGLGDKRVTLERGEVGGSGFAYENWACEASNGTEVLIADTGFAPSMADACQIGKSETTYAYPEDPNNAYSWGCHAVAPPAGKGGGEEGKGGGESKNEGGGTLPPLAKIGSELVTPLPIITTVPPPVLAKTGNVAPVKGTVLVELPGTKSFVSLASLTQIPFGTVIEATNGTVSVTTANPNGTTQTGQFFDGQFILTQGKNGQVLAKLSGGNFSVCPTPRERAHIAHAGLLDAQAAASGKHVVRKLWANAHGKFSTEGNYAAGAVQGTEWLTEDLCEGTLIRVTRDKVAVTNLVNHRHVEVKTGHKYLAKAP